MDRHPPRAISDEIDLYIRTYYSLLRASGDVRVTAVTAAGGDVISGLQMLLNQAFSQVEQFTGRPAPRREMTAALG